MAERISSQSTEYIEVRVEASYRGDAIDPTLDSVQMAFTEPDDDPTLTTMWVDASWQLAGATSAPVYLARCLIGPDAPTQLAEGRYAVWITFTDVHETPVKWAGVLEVV